MVVSRTRLAGLLLALGALATLAAPVIPSHADYGADDPASDITAFFDQDEGLQVLQAWLHVFGATLLVGGLLALHPRLSAAGADRPGLASCVLGTGIAFLAITAAGFIVAVSAIRSANDGYDAHASLLVYNVGWAAMVFAPTYTLPFLLVPFGLLARDAGLPRWLEWLSMALGILVAAIAMASLFAAAQSLAFLGLVALLLWALVGGLALAVTATGPGARPKSL